MSIHYSITLQKLDFNFQNKREKIKMFFQALFFYLIPSHFAIYNVVHKPYKRPNENVQWCYGVCKNDKDDVVLTIKLGSMEWMCITKQS